MAGRLILELIHLHTRNLPVCVGEAMSETKGKGNAISLRTGFRKRCATGLHERFTGRESCALRTALLLSWDARARPDPAGPVTAARRNSHFNNTKHSR